MTENNSTPTSSIFSLTDRTKTVILIVASIFIGCLLFFAVMRYQDSWADKLIFKGMKAKLEQTLKEKETIEANLTTNVSELLKENDRLEKALAKNTKGLATAADTKSKIHTDVAKLKGKQLADALTKGGY